jgi:hypothetical protein
MQPLAMADMHIAPTMINSVMKLIIVTNGQTH